MNYFNKLCKCLLIASTFVFAGCATNKGVVELTKVDEAVKKITVVKNAETRESVLPVLTNWLEENNVEYNVVNSSSDTATGETVLTYQASWSWDMALYMRSAEFKVAKNEIPVGIARFDALQYGGFGKFGDAESRIKILMDVLFGKISRDEADKRLGKE